MKVKRESVHIITLGCSKNLVDSEYLLHQLQNNGFEVYHDQDLQHADIVLLNTCGFIHDAKQESIDMLLQLEQMKAAGNIRKIVVFGCLSQRYKAELQEELPFLDGIFGVYDQKALIESLNGKYKSQLLGERLITTPSHYAYLKISEGCNRRCSFCAIPLIKGKHKSKSLDELMTEARYLASKGVKELILIAQDLSYYGYDLYKKSALHELLELLLTIPEFEWIRLHYAYPANFPMDVIALIKKEARICNYIDLPIQHISDQVLKKMRRGHAGNETRTLMAKLRAEIPDMAIRTTLLVGHPGEGSEEYAELLSYVEEFAFDRLGVFTYSEEEDTYAALHFDDNISTGEKLKRAEEIMQLQAVISENLNRKKIGSEFKVIIDRKEGDYYIGRTQYDSPEVDNEILIRSFKDLAIGNFYTGRVTAADTYDLYAEIK